MADSNTDDLNLLLMEINSHNNDWGNQLNANFEILDEAITETDTHATTGGTTTLTQSDIISPIHVVTGVLVSNATIVVPAAVTKWFIWKNETTGNFTVTVKVTGQTGVAVGRGDTKILRCNGTDVVDVGAPTYSQLGGVGSWIGTISGIDTYTAVSNSLVTQLADGLMVSGFFNSANTSTTPTLNYNSTGGKTIIHADQTALAAGDIQANSVKTFIYRLSTDKWFMVSPSISTLPRLSTANTWAGIQTYQKGRIEVPTALTDAATISWDMSATGRNVTVTLGGNRTLGAPTNVNTGQWGFLEVVQDASGSRTLAFHANFDPMGTPFVDPTISARTVFGYYARSSTAIELWPLYKSARNSIGFYKEYDMSTLTVGATATQTHGLGALPAMVQVFLECVTIDNGYAVGDKVIISGAVNESNNNRGIIVAMNTTNITVRVGSDPTFMLSTAGASGAITAARWKVIARVYE